MAEVIDFSKFQRLPQGKLSPDLVAIMAGLTTAKRKSESIYEINDLDWVSIMLVHMILHARRNGLSVQSLKDNLDTAWKMVDENPLLGMYL